MNFVLTSECNIERTHKNNVLYALILINKIIKSKAKDSNLFQIGLKSFLESSFDANKIIMVKIVKYIVL